MGRLHVPAMPEAFYDAKEQLLSRASVFFSVPVAALCSRLTIRLLAGRSWAQEPPLCVCFFSHYCSSIDRFPPISGGTLTFSRTVWQTFFFFNELRLKNVFSWNVHQTEALRFKIRDVRSNVVRQKGRSDASCPDSISGGQRASTETLRLDEGPPSRVLAMNTCRSLFTAAGWSACV